MSKARTGGVTPMMLLKKWKRTTSTRILKKVGVTTLSPQTPSNSNTPTNSKPPSNTNLACGLLFPVVAEAYPLLCQIGVVLGYLLPYPPDPERHLLAVKVKWYVCLKFIELIDSSSFDEFF